MRVSQTRSAARAAFQRASSSIATRRLSGSTASYRRWASCTAYRACSHSSSSARVRSAACSCARSIATIAASTARGSTARRTSSATSSSGRRTPTPTHFGSPCRHSVRRCRVDCCCKRPRACDRNDGNAAGPRARHVPLVRTWDFQRACDVHCVEDAPGCARNRPT